MASTGQGTTVTFATANGGSALACVRSLTLPEWTMETIDVSCLSDTGFMKKIVADLVDGGEVQMDLILELTDSVFTPDGVQDTITVTLPSAGATGSILAGTGYITSNTLPAIEVAGVLQQSVTFSFDGQTGPTWTPGTAS